MYQDLLKSLGDEGLKKLFQESGDEAFNKLLKIPAHTGYAGATYYEQIKESHPAFLDDLLALYDNPCPSFLPSRVSCPSFFT